MNDHSSIQSVAGPVSLSGLGRILTHEHVCVDAIDTYGDRETALAEAILRISQARDAGIDMVVDATPFDVNRDITFGQEVSLRTGMHIVASTGQRLVDATVPDSRSLKDLTGFFVREIEIGIGDTGIRAGVIKVASLGKELSALEEKVLTAAARAHQATGAPITTHSNSRLGGGRYQADLFESEGVDPARVVIGHSNDTDDLPYLKTLAGRGFILGMDHMFWGNAPDANFSAEARGEVVLQLIRSGYANQLVLSNDWVLGDTYRDGVNPEGLLYTARTTLPFLRAAGVGEETIETVTVENPKRWLGAV